MIEAAARNDLGVPVALPLVIEFRALGVGISLARLRLGLELAAGYWLRVEQRPVRERNWRSRTRPGSRAGFGDADCSGAGGRRRCLRDAERPLSAVPASTALRPRWSGAQPASAVAHNAAASTQADARIDARRAAQDLRNATAINMTRQAQRGPTPWQENIGGLKLSVGAGFAPRAVRAAHAIKVARVA